MTLVAPPKPHPSQRRRTGAHQHGRKHFHKTYWPYLPLLLVVGLGFLANSLWPNQKGVLGYATDMSATTLLVDTNNQRVSHNESNLRLNDKLTAAAQTKANDMATKNYWSHNTPSGQTPWSFITAAGYNYSMAGENLAYGFDNAGATLTGWMNSPEHRANILNKSYREVGFGVVNIPNYQGQGPETLVVAMYATPAAGAIPAGVQTADLSQSAPITSHTSPAVAGDTTGSERVARIQLAAGGQASWSLMTSLVIVTVALALLIVRHGLAWHRLLNRGERFILKHPVLDLMAVSLITVGLLVSHTAGFIQ